jgi:hypothetical protein
MNSAAKSTERGSAKIFTLEPHDHEGIASALGVARANYKITRWMKFGTPAIDRVYGQFEVKPQQLGQLVSQLMGANNETLEVITHCFPYGIPDPEVYRLEVDFRAGR